MKNDTSATDLKASGKGLKNTVKKSSLGITEGKRIDYFKDYIQC